MMKKFLLPMLALSVSLFAEEGGEPRQQNFVQLIVIFGIAIVFFYFILWRPEQKRRKALESQRSGMKPGDRVTAMGIVGTLDRIDEKTIVLKTIDGSKIEMLKMAITEVQPVGTVETP